MTSTSRAAQFVKVHKTLKKHYKPSVHNSGRTVVEHLLYACCLENAHRDEAEEAFAALVHTFFDWNEIRVTSVSELSEVMACLPDPRPAANRIKRVLHAVFEATFNFDLQDHLKKNLGPTVKWLEKLDGTTGFTVAYVVQAALGGHAIPVDAGTLAALRVLDLVADKDVAEGVVPGLERAVAKSKGVEFGSILHEFGADFSANPYSPAIREILLTINPECESRLPKRRVVRAAKKAVKAVKEEKAKKSAKKPGSAKSDAKSGKAAPAKKPSARSKSGGAKTPPTAKASAKKPKAAQAPPSKSARAGKALPRAAAPKKRSAADGIAKRKPR